MKKKRLSMSDVVVEACEEGGYVARLEEVGLYGYGDSEDDALFDLKAMLVNQYMCLVRVKEGKRYKLAKGLKRQLRLLKGLVEEMRKEGK